MARTLITPTVADRTGTVAFPALAALDNVNNNNFLNNGRILLEVKNTSAGALNLVIVLANTALPDTQPGANLTFTGSGVVYSLAASADIVFGPFPPTIYNQSDGTVWVNPAAATLQYRLIQLNY